MGNLCMRFSWHQINSLLIIACILMWVNLQFIQAAWKISQALKSGSKPNRFNYRKCFGCLKKLAFELLQKLRQLCSNTCSHCQKIHSITCHIQATSLNWTCSRRAGWADTISLDILHLHYLLSASFIAQCPRGEFNSLSRSYEACRHF